MRNFTDTINQTVLTESNQAVLLESIIHQIHTATRREELWNSVLVDIKELFASKSASIARYHFSSGKGERIYAAPIDESRSTAYRDKYCVRNPWFLSSTEYRAGRIMTGTDLLPEKDLKKTDYYQQYLKPHGLLHRLCGVIDCHADSVRFIALFRGPRQAAYTAEDERLMQMLLRHLSIALDNHWEILRAKAATQMLESIIDHFDNAAFLVEPDGKILYRNRRADELLKHEGGLRIRDNKIFAYSQNENRQLRRALSELGQTSRNKPQETVKIVKLCNLVLKHQIMIAMRQIGETYSVQSGEHKKVIILTARDPDHALHPHHCSFANNYKLTPAQTRLSELIFSGCALTDIASRLHLSENTIRSHLRQIYIKTDTHSQVDLVQLHVRVCDEHY